MHAIGLMLNFAKDGGAAAPSALAVPGPLTPGGGWGLLVLTVASPRGGGKRGNLPPPPQSPIGPPPPVRYADPRRIGDFHVGAKNGVGFWGQPLLGQNLT